MTFFKNPRYQFNNYSLTSCGASTGQTPAHVPQLMQADSSITKQVSPCDIHPTGHAAAQAPQLIHLSH